jgi:hypothetical protein
MASSHPQGVAQMYMRVDDFVKELDQPWVFTEYTDISDYARLNSPCSEDVIPNVKQKLTYVIYFHSQRKDIRMAWCVDLLTLKYRPKNQIVMLNHSVFGEAVRLPRVKLISLVKERDYLDARDAAAIIIPKFNICEYLKRIDFK